MSENRRSPRARLGATHHARTARKGSVRGVAREQLRSIELAIEVDERVARRDLRLRDRMYGCEPLVGLKLPDGVTEELPRPELIIGVARLDVRDTREPFQHARPCRVEISGLGRPVASRCVSRRRLVVDDAQALERGRKLGIVRVV